MSQLTYVQAIFIGLLQGVTELFPVSSLGHSILVPALIGGDWATTLDMSADGSPYLTFLVAVHVATAAALVIFFRSDWIRIAVGFTTSLRDRRITAPDQRLAWLLLAATVPVGIVGLTMEHLIRTTLGRPVPAAVFLILNGAVLYAVELLRRRTPTSPTAPAADWAVTEPGAQHLPPAPGAPHPPMRHRRADGTHSAAVTGNTSFYAQAYNLQDIDPPEVARTTDGADPSQRTKGTAASRAHAWTDSTLAYQGTPPANEPASHAGGSIAAHGGDKSTDERLARLGWGEALAIGAAQILALLPGISRSGSTITAGLLRGLNHEDAARFAFLLATPVIAAAGILKLPELAQPSAHAVLGPIIVGSVVAGLAAYASLRWLTRYFETHTLVPFAAYCALAGSASLAWFTLA